jgi:hypothetical protein
LDSCDSNRTVSVSLARLQHLEACEARVDLQKQHIQLLQKQIDDSDAVLKLELARGEKSAEALMHIARSCDSRVDELKAHHAAAIAKLQNEAAAKDARLEEMKAEKEALGATNAALEAQVAALQAQTTSKLSDIHGAIAALHTLLPPQVPSLTLAPVAFDCDWCAAACGPKWRVDVDASTGMRAHVTHGGNGTLTLRSAAPLPRRPSPPPPSANTASRTSCQRTASSLRRAARSIGTVSLALCPATVCAPAPQLASAQWRISVLQSVAGGPFWCLRH